MSWVKLDDRANEHRKQVAAGPVACWLWACGLMYCNRQPKHDGFVPAGVVPMLFRGATQKVAAKLVEAGLWDAVEGGYRVHDYHEYQPTQNVADERKERRIERARKAAASRWGNAPSMQQASPQASAQASPEHAPSIDGHMLADAPDPDPDPDPIRREREAKHAPSAPPPAAPAVSLTFSPPDGFRAVYFARAEALRQAKGRPVAPNEELFEDFELFVRRRAKPVADWTAEADYHLRNRAKFEVVDASRHRAGSGRGNAEHTPSPAAGRSWREVEAAAGFVEDGAPPARGAL